MALNKEMKAHKIGVYNKSKILFSLVYFALLSLKYSKIKKECLS